MPAAGAVMTGSSPTLSAVPALVRPSVAVQASFLAAMDEYRAEGRGSAADSSNLGRDIRTWAPDWSAPVVFHQFVDEVLAQALPDTPRPAHVVPTTTLWWVAGADFLGRLAIRHRLAPGRIGELNGHIGYALGPRPAAGATRPRCWRRRCRSPPRWGWRRSS
jgi:predicted acetyltransferase